MSDEHLEGNDGRPVADVPDDYTWEHLHRDIHGRWCVENAHDDACTFLTRRRAEIARHWSRTTTACRLTCRPAPSDVPEQP